MAWKRAILAGAHGDANAAAGASADIGRAEISPLRSALIGGRGALLPGRMKTAAEGNINYSSRPVFVLSVPAFAKIPIVVVVPQFYQVICALLRPGSLALSL